MNFDYPYDGEVPAFENLDAATTNLFYMNNVMHDVWYRYGFDEASGNFQEENYTGTGGFENDYVRAEAQDGSGLSNANFSTPEDGQNPRMQMYLWTDEAANNFTVNAPPSDEALDIEYVNSQAGFGPGIPLVPITADMVLVTDETGGDPYDACESIANGDELKARLLLSGGALVNLDSKSWRLRMKAPWQLSSSTMLREPRLQWGLEQLVTA